MSLIVVNSEAINTPNADPSNFSNHFSRPLIIKPYSRISLVNAFLNLAEASDEAASYEIQIINLPIRSHSGTRSTRTKTVANIPAWDLHARTEKTVFYEAPYPIWIDINNTETLSINTLKIQIKTTTQVPPSNLANPSIFTFQIACGTNYSIL